MLYNNGMLAAFLSLVIIFVILAISELLWQKGRVRGEISRKIIHITVGTFIASWAFYMSFETIQLLSVALFAVVAASKMFHIFHSVHSVDRKTLGELLFPVGIGLAASLTQSPWVFAAAVAHMSLADGFAAIAGTLYLQRNKMAGGYKIFRQTKTIVGSVTFYILSFVITAAALYFSPGAVVAGLPILVFLPVCAAILENISVRGTDNLFVPLLVVIVLNSVIPAI